MSETSSPTDREHPRRPPSIADMTSALNQLDHRYATSKAAVHLATPRDVVLGMGVSFTRFTVTYRGETMMLPYHLKFDEMSHRLSEMVSRHHLESDRYLDLTTDPVHWLKVMRSGASWYLFGANVLFGLPHVRLHVPPTPEIAEMVIKGGGVGVHSTGGENYLIDGDERIIEVHKLHSLDHPDMEPPSVPGGMVQTLQHWLKEQLGGSETAECLDVIVFPDRIPGVIEVEYVFSLPQHQVIIPAAVTATGWVVGAQHANTAPSLLTVPAEPVKVDQDVPDGWDVIEPARWEPGAIARHAGSGITGICRSV